MAKVGLQSRPPPARQGKPFKSFLEVMSYIIEHEGPLALFKGLAPQITKGILVQGLLMMTKERYATRVQDTTGSRVDLHRAYRMEILFIVLFSYLRKLRDTKLQQAANAATARAREVLPVVVK